MASLKLKNPHAVLAALRTRPLDVVDVLVGGTNVSHGWKRVIELANEYGIPVRTERIVRARTSGGRDRNKEGRESLAEATVRERGSLSLDELFQVREDPKPTRGLWLALDQIQDPHNVGAIFRTAGFFGVKGIVMTKHKSAPLTAVAYDVAAGGIECVPFAQVTNLRQAIDKAKQSNLWVLGTSEHAEQSIEDVDRDRLWMVVLGNEESGLRRLTTEHCDVLCSIPSQGGVDSLNVSVATAVTVALLSR